MGGAAFNVELHDADCQRMFSRIRNAARNPAPLMAELGSVLEDSTRKRFKTETAPSGVKWAPINQAWREEKAALKFNTGILKMRGDLLNSVRFESSQHAVEVIEGVPYAGVHQFGATIRPKKGKALKFGGRIVSSVKIPARPSLGISASDGEEIADAVNDFLGRAASG